MGISVETRDFLIVATDKHTGEILDGPVRKTYTFQVSTHGAFSVEEKLIREAKQSYTRDVMRLREQPEYSWVSSQWTINCSII